MRPATPTRGLVHTDHRAACTQRTHGHPPRRQAACHTAVRALKERPRDAPGDEPGDAPHLVPACGEHHVRGRVRARGRRAAPVSLRGRGRHSVHTMFARVFASDRRASDRRLTSSSVSDDAQVGVAPDRRKSHCLPGQSCARGGAPHESSTRGCVAPTVNYYAAACKDWPFLLAPSLYRQPPCSSQCRTGRNRHRSRPCSHPRAQVQAEAACAAAAVAPAVRVVGTAGLSRVRSSGTADRTRCG